MHLKRNEYPFHSTSIESNSSNPLEKGKALDQKLFGMCVAYGSIEMVETVSSTDILPDNLQLAAAVIISLTINRKKPEN